MRLSAAGIEGPLVWNQDERQHQCERSDKDALEDLFWVLNAMCDSVKDARDRSLLLLGFSGGFRRSEIVGLDVADLEKVRQGMIVHLRWSKTDRMELVAR